jgi:four helix bundle protein
MATKTFRELIVWQKAQDLVVETYRLTESFPKSERYGLADQMRRAAVSIPSNIAGSYRRFNRKEKDQFLKIAFGSGGELESQLATAKRIFPQLDCCLAESLLVEVLKILNHFLNK